MSLSATVNFTPEQESAITHRGGALLVSAAAGSGKTKVLVERLLSHIDEGADIDDFLVITYTRAAAFELRERIHDALLERLAKAPGNIRMRRQSLLCRGASIDTIHTFCSGILRENAHLAGLPPDFRVLDDSESDMIKSEVVETVLDEAYEKMRDSKGEGLKTLLDMVIEGRDDKRLSEILLDIHRRLQSTPDPEDWLRKQTEKMRLRDVKDISETDCGRYLIGNLLSRLDFCRKQMAYLTEKMKAYPDFERQYSATLDVTNSGVNAMYAALEKGWDEARKNCITTFPRSKPIKGFDDFKAIRTHCNKELQSCSAVLESSSEEHIGDMKKLATPLALLLQLVGDFDAAYSEEKKSRGAADFSDLEHLIISLLIDKKTGEKTALAKSLAGRYKEIMVDEYQDVNEVQEIIFSAISQNGKNIFMVGDVKQSIYRFRLADPLIFLSKYHSYNDTGTEDVKIYLSKNFRSRAGILEAVNQVFGNIMSTGLGEMEYTKSEMLVAGRKDGKERNGKDKNGGDAAVEIDLLSMEDLENDPSEESPTELQLEAEHIADRISGLVESGYMISDGDGERPVKLSDIVILTRSIKGVAWQFAAALADKGIRADFSGGEGFFETVEVAAALSLLSVIDNPMQDIPLASVLCGPVYKMTSDELAEIRALSRNETYYEALTRAAGAGSAPTAAGDDSKSNAAGADSKSNTAGSENSPTTAGGDPCATALSGKCRAILEDVEQMRLLAPDMSADRFIWHVYNKTSLLGLVSAMKGGERRKSNLILLAEYAAKYEQSGYKGLFGFLTYIKGLQNRGVDLTDGIDVKRADPDLSDSVRIMSIHKSKGLEFPVVFLANTTKKHNYRDMYKALVFHKALGLGSMLIDKQRRIKFTTLPRTAIQSKLKSEMASEELRVLYVAMTRAKEKLIITAALKNAISKMEKMKALSAGKIAPQVLSGMSSIGDWILAGVKDLKSDNLAINYIEASIVQAEEAPCSEAEEAPPHTQAEELPPNSEAEEQPSRFQSGHEAEEAPVYIPQTFDFEYPFKIAPDLPSKLTVTGMKSQSDSESGSAPRTGSGSETAGAWKWDRSAPVFVSDKQSLTPAERGILLHRAMQYIDYKRCTDDNNTRKELRYLLERGVLEVGDIPEADMKKITKFFNSDVGTRLVNASNTGREFKFSLLTEAEKFFPGGGNDKILLQGVIDCFFEENGELVIVDFKSDRISKSAIDERVKRYTPQLDAYAEALERITGKRVKERIIYFFETGAARFV